MGVSVGVRVTLGDTEGIGPVGHTRGLLAVTLDPPTPRHSPVTPSHVRLKLTVVSWRQPTVTIEGGPLGAWTGTTVT